jgi:superfamily II DNA or RNA helicase
MFSQLSFRFPFRKYQRMILEQIAGQQKDRQYHLVAPPGAGKTIIGLELIRQFNVPAVVFAPTTTIQVQWREKVGMFLDPANADISEYASMDAGQRAPINIFTYQLISTPAQAREQLREAGILLWKESLVAEGQVSALEEAQSRLELLSKNNPTAYRKDVLRFTNRVKKKLLQEPDVDIAHFLHPNARQLIDDLLAYGVRTVVLDECHHLLDYWAIVLRYLISRIQEPHVIGLTATLPSPETDAEYENYTSLLGDVDFEIPTPAVVKEGDLAPYRDLAYIVKPTPRETAYLKQIQKEFQNAIRSLTEDEHFRQWVQRLVSIPSDAPDPVSVWEGYWNDSPLLALAAVRFLSANQVVLPKNLPIPVDATDPMQMEDWINLLERYGLDVLKVSEQTKDHDLLRKLRKVIQPFGLTLTERGMSQARSPGDLVLAFSESKDHAVAHILEVESKEMGDQLRAIIVTDFERVGTGVPGLKDVLSSDAGSAVRAFRFLVSHEAVGHLNPVLVTGKSLMIPSSASDVLLREFQAYLKEKKLKATCELKPLKDDAITEVIGDGRDWAPRTYVRMLTALFDRGVVQCMIGTRGIFGEGWDSLSLNTLIDLTSVTTSTSVQQLRGRTIRLDPNWKRKVAHNWDVICVAKEFENGDVDFNRFVKRHGQYWGLVVYNTWQEKFDQALSSFTPLAPAQMTAKQPGGVGTTNVHARVTKGILHVNPYLLRDYLQFGSLKAINFGMHNRYMISQTKYRDKVYDLWGIGEDYSNFAYRATSLNARDLKIRTAFTIQNTLKALASNVMLALMQTFLLLFVNGLRFSNAFQFNITCLFFFMLVLFGVGIGINIRRIYQLAKKLFAEQIPDAILLDAARALVDTLRECGLISRNLNPDYVRVVETDKLSYDVMLDYASPEDATTFINAYGEIFEPVVDQRYLIQRTEDRLPNLGLRMLWYPLRVWVRTTGMYPPAYHPVPKILATRKERVEIFAKHWKKYVGGGEIVYTRTHTGRSVLLAARAQRRPKVKQMAFEIWR